MKLQGLPDFQRPLHGYKFQIFAPYENVGDHTVASSALELGAKPDGRADFRLEMVRGTNPTGPPKPYSVLDFRVRASQPLPEALELIRATNREATVGAPLFRGGFLRLELAANTGEMPEELFRPVELSANGLGSTRFTLRLGPAAGAVIEGALKGEVLGLLAWAELEMLGVAPRLPVTVTFDPAILLPALAKRAKNAATPILTREDLESYFEQDLKSLPLKIQGEIAEEQKRNFIDAMSDLVRLRYADMVASPVTPVEFSMALRMSEANPGRVTWDLREPTAVTRAMIASLDPFDAVRQMGGASGSASYIKQTVVPLLAGGTRLIHVAADLPASRAGVVAIGVDVTAPVKLPFRTKAITQSMEFEAPVDAGVLTLKLAVNEPLDVEYSTWVVVERNGVVKREASTKVRHSGETLDLSIDKFPVRFETLGAAPSLLAVASVIGICKGRGPSGEFRAEFTLTNETPSVGVVVPGDVELELLQIKANELETANQLEITINATAARMIDFTSFPQYGPHTVDVEADFLHTSATLFAVDLMAQGDEHRPQAVQSVFVTPSAPKKQWSYLAASPFRAGYRFRMRGEGESSQPWSDVMPPGAPLRLHDLVGSGNRS